MKSFTVLCLLAVVAIAAARPGSQYTDRYDNINLDEILDNPRLLHPYLKCILEQGRCSPDGKELKSHIKEALEDDCSKCTEKQRSGSRKVIEHVINNEPDYWKQLQAKYDPTRKYAHRYETDAAKSKAKGK